MTDSEKLQSIQKLLSEDNVGDTRNCSRCVEAVPHNFSCALCGYTGKAVSLACACYGSFCASSGSNGAGCPHGVPTCPFCDCGESDVDMFRVIRKIRKIINDN